MSEMDNRIKKYARQIIEDYTRGEFDPTTVGIVKQWLGNGKNPMEKEKALLEYWETLGYTESRRTYEALIEMRDRLGMQEYLSGSRNKGGKDAVMNWYRDMSDPAVNPGAKYYDLPAAGTVEISRSGSGSKRLRGTAMRAAAVIIPVIIVMGAFLWYNAERNGRATEVTMVYATAEGEARRVFLPDGTEVMLNGGSRLEYTGDRQTALSGEAYFKVVSDLSDPFRVKTEKMSVKVTGTEFNIEAYADRAYTGLDLYKGTVEATFGNKVYLMKPGTHISCDHLTGKVTTANVGQLYKPEWVSDRLALRESTLSEIFEMLEWYYDVIIEVPQNIDTRSLYVFELSGGEDLDKALGLLKSVSGSFSHETADGKIIIKAVK